MSTSNATSHRFERYKAVIESARQMPEFSVSSLKRQVRDEQPGFVTRTVKELQRDGHLREISTGPERCYRWTADPNGTEIDGWLRNRTTGNQIKSAPNFDRPRERLISQGAANLRTAELLAILIRSGRAGESALAAGERIASAFNERLEELPAVGQGELNVLSPAIGPTAYCQIMAGIELGRRISAVSDKQITTKIRGSNDVITFCEKHFARLASDAK